MGTGGFDADGRAAVEAHLHRLDAPALAAFVTDLWTRRGFNAERDGTVITATRDGETQTVCVGGHSALPAGVSADIVVDFSGGSDDDSSVLDETDLAQQLWYAVDRPTARRLCKQHFGALPGDLSPPLGVRVRRSLGQPHVFGTLVIAVALLAVMGLGVAIGLDDSPAGTTETPTPDGLAETPSPVRTSSVGQAAINQPLPPGVSPNGIVDIETLGRAHAEAVGDRSYTLSRDVTGTEIRDQRVVTVERDIDSTTDGEEYRIDTDEIVDGDRTQVGVLYHDGQNSYAAPNGRADADFRQLGPLEQQEFFPRSPSTVTASLVETRLSTPSTELTGTIERNNRTLYRVTGSGQPDWPSIGTVEEYNVTALVTLRGFVREVNVGYTVRSGTRLIEVRRLLRYSRVGNTTVAPPAWYGTTGDRNDIGG